MAKVRTQPAVLFSGKYRSRRIRDACCSGLRMVGYDPVVIHERDYTKPVGTFAVFYGLAENLMQAFNDHKAAGITFINVDLGYWGRRSGGRYCGYHKMAINGRHPTEYFNNSNQLPNRFLRQGIEIKPWRESDPDDPILLAGMGPKAAEVAGFRCEYWERRTIRELREYTNRPIIYRPKPSWRQAQPIDGTEFSDKNQSIEPLFKKAHAVVTHHSNVAIDGILNGCPAFCTEGAAVPMALQDFALIEEPIKPEGRQQWASNIAYTQWNIKEMFIGRPFQHFIKEGLIEGPKC